MKKNIFLSIVALTSVLTLSSCSEDDLKIYSPNDIANDNFYTTEDDFKIAITGVYNSFRTVGFYGGSSSARDMIIVGDLLSDNIILNPLGRLSNRLSSNFNYTANNTPTDIYQNGYKIIADANQLLSNIDNLQDGSFKENIKAQALALRALAHFEIVKAYSKIPTQSVDANKSIGIAYREEFNPKGTPSRLETVEEVYNLIIRDMEAALPYLSENVSNYYELNQLSLKGFLAKVYLYKGDYEKVIEYAQPVIDQVSPTPKSLLNGFWKSETNSGALFVLPFSKPNDLQLGTNYSQGQDRENYRFEYTVDKAFVNLYNPSTEPERFNSSIVLAEQKISSQEYIKVYAVNKYMNSREGFDAGINDGRYLRVEDVILMLAEAQYLSGNQPAALVTLNKLRDARYTTYEGNEIGEDLFEAIILERRKELAFEGDRWYTLKRLLGVSGIPAKYSQGIKRSGNGYLSDGTGTASAVQSLEKDSHLWQFPIPQSIILLDKNIQQNDKY